MLAHVAVAFLSLSLASAARLATRLRLLLGPFCALLRSLATLRLCFLPLRRRFRPLRRPFNALLLRFLALSRGLLLTLDALLLRLLALGGSLRRLLLALLQPLLPLDFRLLHALLPLLERGLRGRLSLRLLNLWLLLRFATGLTTYRVVGLQSVTFYWHFVNVLALVVTAVQLSPSL